MVLSLKSSGDKSSNCDGLTLNHLFPKRHDLFGFDLIWRKTLSRKKADEKLECGYYDADDCCDDSKPLKFGNFIFQENNSQCYGHYGQG